MSQIVCENLSFGYGSNLLAENLNFSVNAGDYLCVIGENGSGKSTLIKILLGLKAPDSGRIILNGIAKNELGYLPQQTEMQKDFPASVYEVVISGCQGRCGLRPFYKREEKNLAHEAMNKMNIQNLAGRCYRELSGGQQQRVLLARAFCASRKAIILDEPVAGLDYESSHEMYRIIHDMNHDGMTVIMISHDTDEALRDSTHVLRMTRNRNEKIFFGSKEEFMNHDC